MNPDGTINYGLYKNGEIKEVFGVMLRYEKYVSGNIIADVAILYPTELKVNYNFIESPMSIGAIMREYNVPYNVIGVKI